MAASTAFNLVEEFGTSGTYDLNNPGVLFYYTSTDTFYDLTLSHGPTAVQIIGGDNKFTLADGMYLQFLRLGDGDDTVVTGVGNGWGATIDYVVLGGGTNTVTTGSGGVGLITSHGATNTITTSGSVSQIRTSASTNTIHVGGDGLGVEDIRLFGSMNELQTVTIEHWVDTLICGSGTVANIKLLDGAWVSYARTGHNNDVFNLGNGFAGSVDMKDGNDVVRIKGGDANFIYGRGGNDKVFVTGYDGSQSYMFKGGDGKDTLSFKGSKTGVEISPSGLAVRGFETVIGTSKGDVIADGKGDTTIKGQKGADVIIGGGGQDKLWGGVDKASDHFVFQNVSDSHKSYAKTDRIYQFRSKDKIDLTEIDADEDTAGDQDFTFTGTTATAHSVWSEKRGANAVVYADVDGDTVADFSIEVIKHSVMTASDFIL